MVNLNTGGTVTINPSPLRQELKASDLEDLNSTNTYTTSAPNVPTLIRKGSTASLFSQSADSASNNLADQDALEQKEDEKDVLEVTFFPQLYAQRRMWILSTLRSLNVTKVLDVGCGEGPLLDALCQPATKLAPPPPSLLSQLSTGPVPPSSSSPPQTTSDKDPASVSAAYNDDSIPDLHISQVMGLDVDENALPFAVSAIAPSSNRFELGLRWEELEAQVWKGGLQTVNEAFVGVECIICTEVVEHLEPEALQAVGPILLGIYHPQYLLITTPSYDFNPRFTPPNVANRHGYTDPTKRTNRIFRHGDHKFEWTREEFKQWCQKEAETWGYSVEVGTLGRPQQVDPWGRDNELGGASSWALFRCESMRGREQEMEKKAREVLAQIKVEGKAHELLASHRHPSHEAARKPKSLEEIGQCVKKVMEDCRESFMLVEFLWFTPEVATACGGWIELLIKAIEETDGIILKKDEGGGDTGFSRENWAVGLVGGLGKPRNLWSQDEDQVPPDWTPGEGDSDSADETEWGGSTGVEGDVSLDGSEVEDDEEDGSVAEKRAWRAQNWNKKLLEEEGIGEWGTSGPEWSAKWGEYEREERIYSSAPSTAGWDGDASDDTTS